MSEVIWPTGMDRDLSARPLVLDHELYLAARSKALHYHYFGSDREDDIRVR